MHSTLTEKQLWGSIALADALCAHTYLHINMYATILFSQLCLWTTDCSMLDGNRFFVQIYSTNQT